MKSFFSKISAFTLSALLLIPFLSCNKDECEYVAGSNPGCHYLNRLSLTTGIDLDGNQIAPNQGLADPCWRLLNNPPLVDCGDPLQSTIDGSAWVVNFNDSSPDGWVNQSGAGSICPVNMGATGFGCYNAFNPLFDPLPYVFERSFCLSKDEVVDINFLFKGDDRLYFELIHNPTNTVLLTSPGYVFPALPQSWNVSISLSAGSYSIRGRLMNDLPAGLGFSAIGSVVVPTNEIVLSDNHNGCCDNNVISVFHLLEEFGCNQQFDSFDLIGYGWTVNLRDASNAIVRTDVTDINGELFFAGLPAGVYTVEMVAIPGWTTYAPAGGAVTLTVVGNSVSRVQFFTCKG